MCKITNNTWEYIAKILNYKYILNRIYIPININNYKTILVINKLFLH